MTLRVAVFASGGGTNLQALLDRFNQSQTGPARIVLVISDRDNAGALERARRAGVDTLVVPVAGRPVDHAAGDQLAALDRAAVDLIALAGYLRLVPPAVVRSYSNRIVNIHPALLPAFGGAGMYGLHVHRAVIQSGATVSGATVHLVDEQYDQGRILAQWPVPVLPADTAEQLAERVLAVEHLLFPAAIEALARARAVPSEPVRVRSQAGAFAYTYTDAPAESEVRATLGLD